MRLPACPHLRGKRAENGKYENKCDRRLSGRMFFKKLFLSSQTTPRTLPRKDEGRQETNIGLGP